MKWKVYWKKQTLLGFEIERPEKREKQGVLVSRGMASRERERKGGVSLGVKKRRGIKKAGSQHGAESKETHNKVR